MASRENLEDCPQNRAIISRVPQAFLEAVKEFNRRQLKCAWVPYIPLGVEDTTPKLFRDIPIVTANLLSEYPVLESDEGEWFPPRQLIMVPKRFRDSGSEKPLIPAVAGRNKYLSLAYPSSSSECGLKMLGVGKLDGNKFLDDLEAFLYADRAAFRDMSPDWHAQLAQVLLSLRTESDNYLQRISSWEIIPAMESDVEPASIHVCSWVALNQGTIYLPATSRAGLGVPRGLGIFQVHRSVLEYPAWLDFLRMLGAELYEVPMICNMIVESHHDANFSPARLSLEALVSHAVFLKRAGWSPAKDAMVDLWFTASDGSHHRGSSLYLRARLIEEAGLPFTVAAVFEDHHGRCPVHFLHQEYESKLSPYDSENQVWLAWLGNYLRLTFIPRVAMEIEGTENGKLTLTPEFEFLICNDPGVVLGLLGQWWPLYNKWVIDMAEDDMGNISRARMREALASMVVPCKDGKTQLRNTMLPRKTVTGAVEFVKSLPSSRKAPSGRGSPEERVGDEFPVYNNNPVSQASPQIVAEAPVIEQVGVVVTISKETPPKDPADFVTPILPAKQRGVIPFSFSVFFDKIFRGRLSRKARKSGIREAKKMEIHIPAPGPPKPLEPPISPGPPLLDLSKVDWPTSARGEALMAPVSNGNSDEMNEDEGATAVQEISSFESRLELIMEAANPDVESSHWDFLEHFGVMTRISPLDLLVYLRRLKETDTGTVEDVTKLYQHLEQAIAPSDVETIR